jgi:hypothetical protein
VRLTSWEAEKVNLNAWLAGLQLAAREGRAPPFKVNGPCFLDTMTRKANVARAPVAYVGGEEFRPAEFIIEKDQRNDGILLAIAMVPASMSLLAKVSTVRLPLDKAFDTFEGLEAWVTSIQPLLKPPEPAGVPVGAATVNKEEFQTGESWGSW